MASASAHKHVDDNFESKFVAPLTKFVQIPNLTLAFDENYCTNGLIQKAIAFVRKWSASLGLRGLHFHQHAGHPVKNVPPLVCIVIDAFNGGRAQTAAAKEGENVLIYGHLDKQPHLTEQWSQGLHPTRPVRTEAGLLYGRGAADDGFAPFAALLAIQALQISGTAHPRIVVCLETEEESGSDSLLYLLEEMKQHIMTPSVCVCLDSGVMDFKRLWLTTSLRGMVSCNVTAQALEAGVHSGQGGGVAPETFSMLRVLLDRLDDAKTGQMKHFHAKVPPQKAAEAKALAQEFGGEMLEPFRFLTGVKPLGNKPSYEDVKVAGNVLRKTTTLRLSIRVPPVVDSAAAMRQLKLILEADPPAGTKVTVTDLICGNGWCSPTYPAWINKALHEASAKHFGRAPGAFGVGGSIPFLDSLSKIYPSMHVIALGVCGASSNAHNPDENINLPFAHTFIKVLGDFLAVAGRQERNLLVLGKIETVHGCLMVRSPTNLGKVRRGESTTTSTLRPVTELPYWRRSCETRFIMMSLTEESRAPFALGL